MEIKVTLHIEDTRTQEIVQVKGIYKGHGYAEAEIIGRNNVPVVLCWDASEQHETDSRLMYRKDTDAWTAYALTVIVSKAGKGTVCRQ